MNGELSYDKLMAIRNDLSKLAVPLGTSPTNPDYVPTTHKVYVFSEAPATYGVINLHCSNPYLAWAKEIKYPFIIPVFYKRA